MSARRRLAESAKKSRYVASFLRGGLVHTNLQVHYQCNFRCRICDFWTERYRGLARISVEQARTIADQLARIGPQIVSIGGGEPLLHPELAQIATELAREHFPVMITNGWFVDATRARRLFEAGLYEVSVSVDYADPAKHDRQRGRPGSWERAVRALGILREQRVRPEQRVHMISVVMEDNLDEIEPLLRLCQELGVTYLVTLESRQRGTASHFAQPDRTSQRLLELKRRYPEFVQLGGYLGRFSEAITRGGVGPCYAGKHLCNIDCQGNVTLCIDRLDQPVGNILEDDILELQAALLRSYRSNGCRACWTSCRGSIETIRYGKSRWRALVDYHQMVRPQPLGNPLGHARTG